MVKFLSLNLLYTFTTFGFSRRQGLHQLAQKSSKRYSPLKDERETGLPFISFCVKSRACVPTAPTLLNEIYSERLLPICEDFTVSSSMLNRSSISWGSGLIW